MAIVNTLPRLGTEAKLAGLACPDCTGTLTVRVEGAAGHLRFQCRIGHGYALGSLLAAKEEAIEHRLWSALVSCEELAVLLEELQALGDPYTSGAAWSAATERVERLRMSTLALREVIEGNVPIDLGLDAGLEQSPEQEC
jgi:two-component system chemotaxis response regulator CheB